MGVDVKRLTTVSITASHRTATMTRTPGNPYGIHTNACVHASSAAASSAGQSTGTSKEEIREGRRERHDLHERKGLNVFQVDVPRPGPGA